MKNNKTHFSRDNRAEFNPAIAASLAVMLITIALSGVILSGIRAQTIQTTITQVNDQQITLINGVAVSLGNINIRSNEFYLENATNASMVVTAANYTLNALAGTVTSNSNNWTSTVNATYNFTDNVRTGAYNISSSAETGNVNFSLMSGILGTVLVASIVIGLIGAIVVFTRR